MSLKDLSVLRHVDELARMGISSFKIEGRMKRPEYVAAAVHAFRTAMDGVPPSPEEVERLRMVFSRGGVTDGYLEGQRGRAMFGMRTGEDSRAAKDTYSSLHALYRTERQTIEASMTLTQENKTLLLTASDSDGNQGQASLTWEETLPALESDRLLRQLRKSGGTPFCITSAAVECGSVHARLSQINELRRRALDGLYQARAAVRPVPFDFAPQKGREGAETGECSAQDCSFPDRSRPADWPQNDPGRLPWMIRFAHPWQLPQDLPLQHTEWVAVPVEGPQKELEGLLAAGLQVAVDLPDGLFSMEDQLLCRMKELSEIGVQGVIAQNLASVASAAGLGMTVIGGVGLNVSNGESIETLRAMGAGPLVLSPELTLDEARSVGEGGLFLYGRLPLMLTRNCPLANGGGCRYDAESSRTCRGEGELIDRKKIAFPVSCRGGCSQILNSRPIWMADRLREASFASFGLLWFTNEDGEETRRVLEAYQNGGPPQGEYTRGLYYRGSNQGRNRRDQTHG